MTVDQAQPWRPTLVRGLLCVVLAMALVISANSRDAYLEYAEHDVVSDGGHESPISWFGRGAPRIVERLVGNHHLAINAVVPAEIALAPVRFREPDQVEPFARDSNSHRRSASVRGPPA